MVCELVWRWTQAEMYLFPKKEKEKSSFDKDNIMEKQLLTRVYHQHQNVHLIQPFYLKQRK